MAEERTGSRRSVPRGFAARVGLRGLVHDAWGGLGHFGVGYSVGGVRSHIVVVPGPKEHAPN